MELKECIPQQKTFVSMDCRRLPYFYRTLMQLAYFFRLNEIGNFLFYQYGIKKWDVSTHNQITNVSKAVLSGLAGNTGSQTAFTYVALGTSSTAVSASHTALQAETVISGLTRAAATVSRQTITNTNDTLQLLKTFTSAGADVTINEAGVFNDPSVGVMFGRALTGAKTLSSGDSLVLTYKIQFI